MSLMREERPSTSLFAAFIYSRTYRTTPPSSCHDGVLPYPSPGLPGLPKYFRGTYKTTLAEPH